VKSLLIYWLMSTLGILIVSALLPGVEIKGFETAFLVFAAYGILHFVLYKLFVILSMPFIVITFGLFVFIIDAFILFLTDMLIKNFEIDGFGTTIVMAVLLSIINSLLRFFIKRKAAEDT
jgi:putative membrane protein